ncbi:T9SS type A sorting domain-containing protein [Algoriphagus aquimarinus]|uniref:T9SS type A sorting domain-containing protein n=1 Tax=Algoriphagus aquimarinus TaxID=237018 RepID=A0A5C7AY54_9BACT|nr:T9SS type A sorting domain-containing protein [Algoriphagus aquimarinus]TXE13736.1 T9SS type A sorting domain-containing protein [Algoriphagus aquimarinus]
MNMKNFRKVVLLLILLFASIQARSQVWDSGIKATGDNQFPYEPSVEINVDYYGNRVIAGHFQRSFSLGPHSIITEDDYYSDIFLSRINKNGEVEWLKHIEGGNSYADDIGVTVDEDSNIYLTGSEGNIFVSKYDSLGNLVWHQDFEKEHAGYGASIATDQFDNVYVIGENGWEFFMAKLDFEGNPIWKKDFWYNSSAAVNLSDMAVDALGNIYFSGVFGIKVLKVDDVELVHDVTGGNDTFFGKVDSQGNVLWIKSSTGRTNSEPQIALTADNHIYLSGALFTGLSFEDIFIEGICCQNPKPYIAKYTTEGELVWAKEGFTTYSETGATCDIKSDYDGNLYLTGTYFTCYGCTETDFYLEKYNKEGDHLWRVEMNMGSSDYSHSIDIDNNGFLYNIGYNYSADFIDPENYVELRTIGLGKLSTGSTTRKRTPRPRSERFVQVCDINETINLEAKGENIKWYSDPSITNEIEQGNTYSPSTISDTLYVTQTLNQIESWPKQVIIYVSEIPDSKIMVENDTLRAPKGINYQYQWLYENDTILNATESFVSLDSTQNYSEFSVIVTDINCSRILDQVDLITSIDTSEEDHGFSIYPNPTTGILNLNYLDRNADLMVSVINVSGKEVFYGKIAPFDPPYLNLELYPNGIYLVRIFDGMKIHTVKVLKH